MMGLFSTKEACLAPLADTNSLYIVHVGAASLGIAGSLLSACLLSVCIPCISVIYFMCSPCHLCDSFQQLGSFFVAFAERRWGLHFMNNPSPQSAATVIKSAATVIMCRAIASCCCCPQLQLAYELGSEVFAVVLVASAPSFSLVHNMRVRIQHMYTYISMYIICIYMYM